MLKYPDLKDKKILVTGAMRGLGRAMATTLAQNGAFVIFNYRSKPEKAQEFVEYLKSEGVEFVREPDAHLGFLFAGATMGQLLSLPLILVGLGFAWYALSRPPQEAETNETGTTA